MQDELITFETAVLAKEKGFNWPTNAVFRQNKEVVSNSYFIDYNSYNGAYSCPTQTMLQRWLREICRIEVWAYPAFHQLPRSYFVKSRKKVDKSSRYDTFESALEAGLQQTLKLIP